MAYTVTLKSRAGSTVVAEVPATALTFNTTLNAPGAASITVPLQHASVTAANFAVGQREVYIYRGEELVWSGELWVAQADTERQTLRLSATGFYDRLRRRLIEDDKQYTFKDSSYIVKDLIDYAQSKTAGNMGLDASDFGTFGPSLTLHWCCWDGSTVADAIEQLAGRLNGFDFEITPAKKLKGYKPRKALSSSKTFTLGTSASATTNILALSVEADASELANIVGGLPPDDDCLDCTDVVKASDATSRTTYGRLDEALDLSDIRSPLNREHVVDRRLEDRKDPVVRIELTTRDLPFGGSYETGSQVAVTANLGWIAYTNTLFRILGWEVEVDAGYETARLTLDSVTY